MPENEIPPVIRGDIYFFHEFLNNEKNQIFNSSIFAIMFLGAKSAAAEAFLFAFFHCSDSTADGSGKKP